MCSSRDSSLITPYLSPTIHASTVQGSCLNIDRGLLCHAVFSGAGARTIQESERAARLASFGSTHSTAVKGRSSTRMRVGFAPPPSCSTQRVSVSRLSGEMAEHVQLYHAESC